MSTAVAVKTALVDLLGPLTGVQVSYGDDVRAPRKERIYFGDIETADAAPVAMRSGKARTEEDYSIAAFLLVDSKKGQAACETRLYVLLGILEDLLATDPKLSGATVPPGILFATFGGYTLSTSIISEGEHRSMIEAEIFVKARNV